MTGFLIDFSGKTFELPVLLDWELSHGIGTPCDAFNVSFLYDQSMQSILSDACRFKAVHDGDTVFYGVVDEYAISADNHGLKARVQGRGLAALLLDNESEAAQYTQASLQSILDKHVYPWGVTNVKTTPLPPVNNFIVNSGASQWRVLENFAWFSGSVIPRFSRDGVLILDNSSGDSRRIDSSTAIASQTFKERRYGVVSRALVKNRAWNISSTVDNAKFIARGGSCRRVVNVPRYTNFDAMRHTGEYQIARSEDFCVTCELVLLALFAAFPGDIVDLQSSPAGITGSFKVCQTRCWADAASAGTVVTLSRLT